MEGSRSWRALLVQLSLSRSSLSPFLALLYRTPETKERRIVNKSGRGCCGILVFWVNCLCVQIHVWFIALNLQMGSNHRVNESLNLKLQFQQNRPRKEGDSVCWHQSIHRSIIGEGVEVLCRGIIKDRGQFHGPLFRPRGSTTVSLFFAGKVMWISRIPAISPSPSEAPCFSR